MAANGHIYQLIIKPLDSESVNLRLILILSVESTSGVIYAIICYKRIARSISRANNAQCKAVSELLLLTYWCFFQHHILKCVLFP